MNDMCLVLWGQLGSLLNRCTYTCVVPPNAPFRASLAAFSRAACVGVGCECGVGIGSFIPPTTDPFIHLSIHHNNKTNTPFPPFPPFPTQAGAHLLLLLLVQPPVRLGLAVERRDERLVLPAGLWVAVLGDLSGATGPRCVPSQECQCYIINHLFSARTQHSTAQHNTNLAVALPEPLQAARTRGLRVPGAAPHGGVRVGHGF